MCKKTVRDLLLSRIEHTSQLQDIQRAFQKLNVRIL